jgi:glycosyltransferase involved in cell wall biosynthesis
MTRPLRITYLLEDTAQSGGIRILLAQGDELVARGHSVRMVTKGPPFTWRSSNAELIHVSQFSDYDASEDDFVVGTFWLTVEPAQRMAPGRVVHLCQGYEGAFSVYQEIQDQIADVYRLPIPKLVVARSLIGICRRFSDDVTWIGQIVEKEFYRPKAPPQNAPLRVLMMGQAQADLKGIADGYEAVRQARSQGAEFELVRASPWLPAEDEPTELADEFHAALNTADMTAMMHSCDLLVAPNHAEEGFGLPAAEAMASRIPCVMTSIPSYLSFDEEHDYAVFAPEKNPPALGDALTSLLRDVDLRNRIRERAAVVAEQFRVEKVIDRLEAFFFERLTDPARTRKSGK